ncbi:hypothetical protein TRICI_004525 [Trichomonascus ciferrii]|uniref:Mso1 N-terminal domain-containing protein n=1 Tax=Trichomonascus ciferrii TaxID=44093 RepID=A0A642V0D5_9ASCO|nr:hypothetical protein TRICI_004525 [Trichomonascus ciferrii]
MDRSKKDGFWTRIRHQYGSASAALSNLSIHSETDGDSETDTVVHNALVKYYMKEEGGAPAWLGVEEQQVRPTSSSSSSSLNRMHMQQTQNRGNMQRNHTTRGQSALQDIYNRRQQQHSPVGAGTGTAQASAAAPAPAPGRMPPRAQTFNYGDPSSAGNEKTDRFKNRLKSAGRANW